MILENEKLKLGDVHNLNMAIQMLMTSCTNMTGRTTFALNENAKALSKILAEEEPKRLKIFKDFCKVDKEGKIVYLELTPEEKEKGMPPLPEMKKDKKREDLDKALQALIGKEYTVKIRKMNLTDFGRLEYNPQQNPFISVICDVMVTEQESKLVMT